MSVTISFRCSEELAEFLESEAERRMTTKSAVAQMLVAEKAREMMGQTGSDEGADHDLSDYMDGNEIEFPDRESARAFRDAVSENLLSEDDDARLNTVTLNPSASLDAVREAALEAIS